MLALVSVLWFALATSASVATGGFSHLTFISVRELLASPKSIPCKSSLFPRAVFVSDTIPEAAVDYVTENYYAQSHLEKKFERAGGIIYCQSVLAPEEFTFISQTILFSLGSTIRLNEETTSSIATKRLGAELSPDSEIVRILGDENGSVSQLVNSFVRKKNDGNSRKMVLSKDVPVEVRIYEKTGAGMDWHVDDILFEPEQIEIVFTVENDSDCVTVWEEPLCGTNPVDYKRVEVETARNSAIFLKAGGVRHKVSPLRKGRRVILKFVYVMEGSAVLDSTNNHVNQFVSLKYNGKSRRVGKRGKKSNMGKKK